MNNDLPTDQFFIDLFEEAVAMQTAEGVSLLAAKLAAFRETVLCYREFSTIQPTHRTKLVLGMERCRFLSPLEDDAYQAAWASKASAAET